MKRKFVIPALAVLVLFACEKEETATPSGPATTINSLSTVFADNVVAATQYFTVDASTGGVLYGAKGARVSFSPNAFLDLAGNPVTGNVEVRLVEANSIGDMLWLNKQTVGNNNGTLEFLKSGGEIRLTASQNGAVLKLAPSGSEVMVPFPDAPDGNMELFSGDLAADGAIIWNPFAPNAQGIVTDTLGYLFPNDTLGWINCDYFYDWPGSRTDMTISAPFGYDELNTMVWVVFPQINSIASVPGNDNGVFSLTDSYQIPIGEDIHIVSLHDNGDNTFTSSFTSLTVSSNMTLSPSYQSTSLSQFQSDCENL